ncbi:MAG: GDP-mannose 4,6-dehydratase [Patescibacteria group bacterium]|nr:GDP-mannose 4,6-dehydratase [Patescibacteria group bacterium]MDD5491031.1 GDP-mannose 4,6-dehydratase [Patescibacteria group bacterium]
MEKKKALITGITGQDGSYLAEFLLDKGYKVYGIQRRSSSFNTERINHLYDNPNYPDFLTFYGDLSDGGNIRKILQEVHPDEIYHLGAQSHVRVSFDIPEYTGDVTALSTVRILEAIRGEGLKTKFYQASSSEMFGQAVEIPQKETTAFYPRSPYGCAKVYAYWITKNYRESYGLFACNGILFNHESPRRGETFVTRKVTRGLSRIKLGKQDILKIGNLEARRDWGYAPDYVKAMWLMMQREVPDDYVIATGESHSVRELIEEVARCLDFDLVWQGAGLEEKGVDTESGKIIVEIDPVYYRPSEVDALLGDASKAKEKLGWEPVVKFKELIGIMVKVDYDRESKINY